MRKYTVIIFSALFKKVVYRWLTHSKPWKYRYIVQLVYMGYIPGNNFFYGLF